MPEVRVSLFGRSESDALARQGEEEAAGGLTWASDGLEALWRYAAGHPFLTQAVCSEVWEALVRRGRPPRVASAASVEMVLESAIKLSNLALNALGGGLTPACQVVAAILAQQDAALTDQELQAALYAGGVRVTCLSG